MGWQADTAYIEGLSFFSAAVGRVGPDDWSRPSPCAGWRVLDVVGHLGAGVSFATSLLHEQPATWEPVEPPGAAITGDPLAWWNALVDPARQAVADVDLSRVLDSPRGPRSIGDGLAFPALDLFIHGWDVGRSLDLSLELPPEAMAFATEVLEPIPPEQMRSPRVFADEVAAPQGATPTESFIAWTGRDPRWSPPAPA